MICIGSPLWNTQVYILDPHGLPAPIGVEGEIYIGGVGVARGYLNRSDLTVDKFLPDPFSKLLNTTMYRTGDLAVRLPNGKIVYRGRNDDLVKIRGFRIELGEIQAHLIGHPEVQEAVVVARKDKSGVPQIYAYFAPIAEVVPSSRDLRAYLVNYLPDYIIPAAYICMSAFPITPNGKLDRRALPDPEESAYSKNICEAPSGKTEAELAAIWSELFNIKSISRFDNCFHLGGDSRLAVQFVLKIGNYFKREIPLKDLFDNPLLWELAAAIETADTKDRSSQTVPYPHSDQHYPLSYFRKPIGRSTNATREYR